MTESLVSFPPERRADGCFYGPQYFWVQWHRDESGSVVLTHASPYPHIDNLLPYITEEKRADAVRQIIAREARASVD